MSIITLTTTNNFVIKYDSSNSLAQGMAQAISNICESDFSTMAGWFGITTGFGPSDRITVTVQSIAAGGANNSGYRAGGNTTTNVNTYDPMTTSSSWTITISPMMFVNELSEVFMSHKWPTGNIFSAKSSDGEGLSQFCGIQLHSAGHYAAYPSMADKWLTASPRPDWVNKRNETDGDWPSFGCALLFLNFLNSQLGFTPARIIQAGGPTLAQTYQNLTGDPGSPLGFFSYLVDTPTEDNPFPLFTLSIVVNKNTFSKSEVQNSINTNQPFLDVLRVTVEGFSPATWAKYGSLNPGNLSWVAPSLFPGVQFPLHLPPIFENPALNPAPQRIEFSYDATFDNTSLSGFSSNPQDEKISATLTVSSTLPGLSASAELTFYGAEDPYFVTFAPGADNVFWLCDDLHVFSAIGGTSPVGGYSASVADNVQGAYAYITGLIKHLSQNYGDPSGVDPFDPNNNIVPGQSGALQGDSSVIPNTPFLGGAGPTTTVYNFAIARVRLNGAVGTSTNLPVKVFFRIWSTNTPDTTYNDLTTYDSQKDTLHLPDYPLPAPDNTTMPFFATNNDVNIKFSDQKNAEYGASGANSQFITIKYASGHWIYFGAFLNVYDPNNTYNGQGITNGLLPGTHHCLVAQIAYDDAPIETPTGAVVAPGSSDKLAQRNLQISPGYNPGLWPSNRVPNTFDVSATSPAAIDKGLPFDELAIDWGQIPKGTLATICWPGASAAQVTALADRSYAFRDLKAIDANTIQIRVVRGLTYVPIPIQSGPSLAGLLTLELPPVSRDNSYTAIIKRATSKLLPPRERPPPRPAITKSASTTPSGTAKQPAISPIVQPQSLSTAQSPIATPQTGPITTPLPPQTQPGETVYRITTGAFQINIPIQAAEEVLPYDEETLSIMKYRLGVIGRKNKWYPVLTRYVEILNGRIDGHGPHSNGSSLRETHSNSTNLQSYS